MGGLLSSVAAIAEWLSFGQRLVTAGKPAYDAVMAAAQAHGVQSINDAMSTVITEAAAYKALADAQVTATK